MIRDEMKLYQNYESGNLRCSACMKSNHILQQCTYVHYIPDKKFLIRRHNYTEMQTRSPNFIRKTHKKVKALKELDNIDEALEKLWDDEEFEALTDYNDDFPDNRLSIEKFESPLQVLPETSSNLEESKIFNFNTPSFNMRTSNYLLTKRTSEKNANSVFLLKKIIFF